MNLRGKTLVYGDDVAKWVWNRLNVQEIPGCAAIGLMGEKLLSGVVFSRYHPGVSIELSIVSEGVTWAVPDYFRAIFAYPFKQLDCQRATAAVGSRNVKSRALCERLGFVQEGVLKYGFKDDDAVMYGIYRKNRWTDDLHET